MPPPTLIAIGAVATAGLVLAEWRAHADGRTVTKVLASSAFVGQAIACGALRSGLAGWLLVLALLLSWAGDLWLLRRDRGSFRRGLVAFLLAHLAFAASFAARGPSWPVAGAVGLGVIGLGLFVASRLRAGALAGAVAAYASAIGLMVALAAGVAAADPDRVGVLLGAALFWASDLCVARDRFARPAFVNRAIGLPLYYAAQFLLASLP